MRLQQQHEEAHPLGAALCTEANHLHFYCLTLNALEFIMYRSSNFHYHTCCCIACKLDAVLHGQVTKNNFMLKISPQVSNLPETTLH